MIPQAMKDLAAYITAETGTYATTDPKKAATNRPCVLVDAPIIQWTGGTLADPVTLQHRLVVLAGRGSDGTKALDDIDRLLFSGEKPLSDVLTLTVDSPPTLYPLGSDRVPCYVLTLNPL